MIINGKNYTLKATGKTLLLYKEEFGKNMFEALKNVSKDDEDSIETCFKMIWALSKTTDDSLPSFKEWFSELPLNEIKKVLSNGYKEVLEVIYNDVEPKKEVKKNNLLNLKNQ